MVSDLFEHLRQSAAPLISPIGTPQPKELEAVVRAMANVAQEWVAEQSIAPKSGAKKSDLSRFPRPPPDVLWLRPKDAARAAGISRSLVYEWMAAGRLVTRKVGGVRLILAASLAALEDVPSGRNGRRAAKLLRTDKSRVTCVRPVNRSTVTIFRTAFLSSKTSNNYEHRFHVSVGPTPRRNVNHRPRFLSLHLQSQSEGSLLHGRT